MKYLRPNIQKMEGYKPGEQISEGYTKLNTNENPYPPSPGVLEALRGSVDETLKFYPLPCADPLREKAAEVYGLAPEKIMAGNGSDELLTIAIRALVGEGDRIAYPWPSYVLYPVLAAIQNADAVAVPFPDDYSMPKDLAETDARITMLSNPNSPTGTFIPVDDVADLASRVSGVVLVDEAYVDFADDNCIRLVSEYDNVIITRSFSKSFSLAGMRIGLAFAAPDLIAGMIKVKDSYNLGRMCVAAGVAALDDIDYMRGNAARIRDERTRLLSELEKRNFYVLPSSANFVLARPADMSARKLYSELKNRKILVRYFDLEDLPDCVRITVGTAEQNDRLMAAIDAV